MSQRYAFGMFDLNEIPQTGCSIEFDVMEISNVFAQGAFICFRITRLVLCERTQVTTVVNSY
jgi:hypothetical protein